MSNAMATPTNWLNPERPGVPPNPDVSGWYWICMQGLERPLYWNAGKQEWLASNQTGSPRWTFLPNWKFLGAAFTPTQLTELLAGERERCAVISEREFLGSTYPDEQEVYARGRSDAARDIRNLGDAL